MECKQGVMSVINAERGADSRLCAIQVSKQRIDHDVADKTNSLCRDPFGHQIGAGVTRWRE